MIVKSDLERAAQAIARIEALDTPENEIRIRNELENHGCKLGRKGSGACRFKVTLPKGDEIEGISLADVEDMLEKIGKQGQGG